MKVRKTLDTTNRRMAHRLLNKAFEEVVGSEPERINSHRRTRADIPVGIQPGPQPQRVRLDVPTGQRVIVAPHVLREPGLGHVVLTGET